MPFSGGEAVGSWDSFCRAERVAECRSRPFTAQMGSPATTICKLLYSYGSGYSEVALLGALGTEAQDS